MQARAITLTSFLLLGAANACGDDGGEPAETLEVVADFDPAAGQLPEGLAVRGDEAFVSFAFPGEIHRVPIAGGAPAPYARLPGLPAENAFITGLAFDDQGRLLVAAPSFAAEPAAGVYRAGATGGDAELVASHEAMVFPSAIGQHSSGDLFVTDSATATILRIATDGEVEAWLTDDKLAGDRTICGREGAFDVGANGMVVTDSAIYVAVSDQASIVEVAIEPDGSAGALTTVAGPDCDALGGIDGIALDGDSLIVALNHQNRIARVGLDGSIETVTEGGVLDFPSTVRLARRDGRKTLLVTSFAFVSDDPRPSLAALALE